MSRAGAALRAHLAAAHGPAGTGPILRTPCAHDGLSARLIQRAGFKATFVSGYAVAATKGLPDTGYVSYAEQVQRCGEIVEATSSLLPGIQDSANAASFPVICDADTGYGNEMNVKRTIQGFVRLGAAGVMLEDQVSPKRCGHAKGKSVVSYEDAVRRIEAAVEARNVLDPNLVIIARTDARAGLGLDEALRRAHGYRRAGADITFVEAPESEEELRLIGEMDRGWKMANLLLGGKTPILEGGVLRDMGFTLAAYPFDLLIPSIRTMQNTLRDLFHEEKRNRPSKQDIETLWDVTGFNQYLSEETKYKS